MESLLATHDCVLNTDLVVFDADSKAIKCIPCKIMKFVDLLNH